MSIDHTKYPLDVSALNKGDDITEDQCIQMMGTNGSDPLYQLKLLELRDEIRRAADMAHRQLSIVIRKRHLHVNTDAEASEYHFGRVVHGRRQIMRESENLRTRVDASFLTDHQKMAHDRQLLISGMLVARIHEAGRIASTKPKGIEQEKK